MEKKTLYGDIFLTKDFLSNEECENYLSDYKTKEFEEA